MATLIYRIETTVAQAERIIAENPNIDTLSFALNDCPFSDIAELSQREKRDYSITNGKAEYTFRKMQGETVILINLKTKPLIVSQTVQEVEE